MQKASETKHPKLEEARRRWGRARVLSGKPMQPKPFTPAPAAVAVAYSQQIRRAA